jgi:hypothetical protein
MEGRQRQSLSFYGTEDRMKQSLGKDTWFIYFFCGREELSVKHYNRQEVVMS